MVCFLVIDLVMIPSFEGRELINQRCLPVTLVVQMLFCILYSIRAIAGNFRTLASDVLLCTCGFVLPGGSEAQGGAWALLCEEREVCGEEIRTAGSGSTPACSSLLPWDYSCPSVCGTVEKGGFLF